MIKPQQKHPTSRKQLIESIQQMYEELTVNKSELDEEVQLHVTLQEQVESFFQGHYGIRFCTACKKKYTPLNNHNVGQFYAEKACHYHPGQLNYFHCRGCGADEYYDCCNRCHKCLPGCRYGSHAPAK